MKYNFQQLVSMILLACGVALAPSMSLAWAVDKERSITTPREEYVAGSTTTNHETPPAAESPAAAQAGGLIEKFKSLWSSGVNPPDGKYGILPPQCEVQNTSPAFGILKTSLSNQIKSCFEVTKALHKTCTPVGNSHLINVAAGAAILGNAASSLNDSCKKMNGFLEMGIAGVNAYSTACALALSAQLATCAANRVQARNAFKAAAKQLKIESAPTSPTQAAAIAAIPILTQCELATLGTSTTTSELTTAPSVSPSGSDALTPHFVYFGKYNDKYTIYLASAATGVLKMLTSQKGAKSCESDTSTAQVDCAVNPADPSCADMHNGLNCSLPANAGTAICICRKNPNQDGCQSAVISRSASGSSTDTYGTNRNNGISISNDTTSDPSIPVTIGDDSSFQAADTSGGGGGPSGFSGGGGGGGASGGPLGGADSGRGGGPGSKINTDIYSGYEGGSGYRASGGGSGEGLSGYGGSGGGSGRKITGVEQKPRLPSSLDHGITLRSGKSNFEKIGERFIELRGTLTAPAL